MKTLGGLLLSLICIGLDARLSAQGTDEGYQLWLKFQCDICHYNQGHGKASATSNPLAGTPLPFEAFAALTRFVAQVPARAIDFPSGEAAIAMVDRLWSEIA